MKLKLACALPFRPKLLVLDEPFSGLDPLVRDEFMERLLDQAGNMTVLISTHELADVEDVATHVAFLEAGQLLFQESMSELTGRMRQVQIVLNQEATAPVQPPRSWLQVRTMGNTLSFVETQFSQRDSRYSHRHCRIPAAECRSTTHVIEIHLYRSGARLTTQGELT